MVVQVPGSMDRDGGVQEMLARVEEEQETATTPPTQD